MVRDVITWHVFLETLRMQPRAGLDQSFNQWRFSDSGVFKRIERPQPANNLLRKVENTVLELIKPNRRRTLH